jgi:prevent-host-death family protein
MKPIRPSADVRSLSEFRANVASLVQQVQKTRRPLVLTVHGRGAAVLLDAEVYDDLIERLGVVEDIEAGIADLDVGRSLPHEDVKRRIRKRLGR